MFLVSDLPLLLKGLYFDGWKMNQPPTPVFTMEDFLEEVKKNVIEYFGNQFSRIQLTVDKVKAVIQVLRDYVSANGFWHIRNQMPKAAIGLFDVEE